LRKSKLATYTTFSIFKFIPEFILMYIYKAFDKSAFNATFPLILWIKNS